MYTVCRWGKNFLAAPIRPPPWLKGGCLSVAKAGGILSFRNPPAGPYVVGARLWECATPFYPLGCFIVRPMRFLGTSTLSTHTLTMSPTFSTSEGCLM